MYTGWYLSTEMFQLPNSVSVGLYKQFMFLCVQIRLHVQLHVVFLQVTVILFIQRFLRAKSNNFKSLLLSNQQKNSSNHDWNYLLIVQIVHTASLQKPSAAVHNIQNKSQRKRLPAGGWRLSADNQLTGMLLEQKQKLLVSVICSESTQ